MGDEKMRSIKGIKALLIDLNGTVHVGNDPTPRAAEAIAKLRRAHIPFLFCSNNTKESTKDAVQRLADMGISAETEEVMTSLGACRQLVDDQKLRPYLLLSPSAKEEFAHLPVVRPDEHDSVILGQHPPSLSYEALNKAFRILKGEPIAHDQNPNRPDRKPLLIAPHTSSFLQAPATSDLPAGLSLGLGPFVKALESATGLEATIVGKPTRRFFEMAIERLNELYPGEREAGEYAVVGDDIVNDLGAGTTELGLRRILVRTGKYRPGAEAGERPPDSIFDKFADLVDAIV
ncbi:HAD-like domain-containing protein [Dioszegia hungarica]|uniref:HAD-like domain-containing protein n=1 Tax=Dioszegia hungarica TaxID=4972 RepID=A0AA38H4L4_9TREE|nr:HAD-like domain-containing protein [Dioszegia hungarica]KAI9632486.1 HAD-like domain-containing protein [Dioszegia hungarica]